MLVLLHAYLIASLFLYTTSGDQLPTCHPNDFHYEYTECDSAGGRWRVSVPQPDKCTGGAPNPPIRGKECKFTCSAGSYLDMESQECKPCPAGKYSLGGGVRFSEWDHLPAGFEVKSEGFSTKYIHSGHSSHENCSKSGWNIRGDYIAATSLDCMAILTYSANLVKAGLVRFEYQFTDTSSVFHFVIRNDQCMSYGDSGTSKWPGATEDGEWKSITVHLKSGINILRWKVFGISSSDGPSKPLKIRNIEIEGVAFTSECTSCKAGTYSQGGNQSCTNCVENTFSQKGSDKCTPCDTKTEYSDKGSAKCKKRKACSVSDYFEYSMPCDEHRQTKKMYKWVEPKVCREDMQGAVKLPASGQPEKCPPCNPGMWRTNGTKCSFCPENEFSDGTKACELCPVSTAPRYAVDYQWWNEVPPNLKIACATSEDHGCATEKGWQPAGDHIHSGHGHGPDAYLLMILKIDGFHGSEGIVDGKPITVAKISFVFQLDCDKSLNTETDTKCEFFFMRQSEEHGTSVLQTWEGTQNKQEYTYVITSTSGVKFSWAFQKTTYGKIESPSNDDIAKVYSIKVTNTLNGGASECKPCPMGAHGAGCIPCDAGKYIKENTTECVECPENTVIHTHHGGIESCKSCPKDLKAHEHKTCYSDCHYTDGKGREYDFSPFNGYHQMLGATQFTGSGTQYFHQFNFSLCGLESLGKTSCVDNATFRYHESAEYVYSQICRSTIIPPKRDGDKEIISTQPTSLGDSLVEITRNISNNMLAILKKGGYVEDTSEIYTHFIYKSESYTRACKEGRQTIITLHCDISEKGTAKVEMPPSCPDGTCDGCNFHMVWHSRLACPKCKSDDYDIVKGECVKGKQKVHYYPPKHCMIEGNAKPKLRVVKCSTMTIEMYIAIGLAAFTAILLMALVFYCWNKNKSLEYKYMKLVTGSKDGELPAAETCGYDDEDDGEDDQFDEVQFKNKNFFQKLKGMGKKDDNPFESIKLTDKSMSAI